MTYYGDEAFPALSDEQWARPQAYGSAQEVESGALLWGAGEATYDLILVDSVEAEVVQAVTARAAEAVVARFGTGQFTGELGLLTGQATYLSSRVSKPGQVHRISPVSFRQLMDEDPDLSDVILRALMARRRKLRGVRLPGPSKSWAARCQPGRCQRERGCHRAAAVRGQRQDDGHP
jgi:thioredoxin reductase (NADPH)